MTSPILRLNSDELSSALAAINPVDALVDDLVGRAAGGVDGPADCRLTTWQGDVPVDGEPDLVLLEDRRAGSRCLLPSSTLRVFRAAALAALAARELVTPGVVTAAVPDVGFPAQVALTLIARHLPGLSHVALCPSGDEPGASIDPRVVDQLDLAGVGWLVAADVVDAVFGATLVVLTAAGTRWPEIGQLTKGAVLVNATGEDLPDELVDAVDQIYVDDCRLIEGNSHRYFARMHMAGSNPGSTTNGRTDGRRYRRVEADLPQVLAGAHQGRTQADHVLLVELLDAQVLDTGLARLLHRAALDQGLGVRMVE